jgi:hypothetical protein
MSEIRKTQTFTKINTLYRRYQFDGKSCPNQKWLKFKNKIILGDFSDETTKYLFHNLWEATSKLDGTNSKIVFYPSIQEIKVGGKSDNASSMHGQFEMLQEIADRIKPMLCDMFPKESARFTPIKDGNKVRYWDKDFYDVTDANSEGLYGVELEEVPVYIYGEYFGCGIQKCGSRYIQNGNAFRVFDICQQGWWLPKENRDAMCKGLGLEQVPYIGNMVLADIENIVRNGFPTKFEGAADPTMIEEGIVARPTIPICDARGNRIIVKVKHCDYVEYDAVRREFTDEEFEEFNNWYHTSIEKA